jgi:hypothetical protein
LGWNNEDDRGRLLRILIKRVEVARGVIRVQLDPAAAISGESPGLRLTPRTIEISADTLVKGASSIEVKAGKDGGHPPRRLDAALIRGVVRGYRWRNQLLSGEVGSVAELARKAGINRQFITRMVRMGLLAPDIIEAILEGRQTAALSLERFRKPIPLDWDEQRLMLGFVR